MLIGCQRSPGSLRVYRSAADDNANLANTLKKYVLIGGFVTFAPALFVPLSYLVLGFPEPDNWVLPFPAK